MSNNIDHEKTLRALDMIAKDMEDDAKNFDGKPFNGKTFGNHGAAIAALASIVKEQAILFEKYRQDHIMSDLRDALEHVPKPRPKL